MKSTLDDWPPIYGLGASSSDVMGFPHAHPTKSGIQRDAAGRLTHACMVALIISHTDGGATSPVLQLQTSQGPVRVPAIQHNVVLDGFKVVALSHLSVR